MFMAEISLKFVYLLNVFASFQNVVDHDILVCVADQFAALGAECQILYDVFSCLYDLQGLFSDKFMVDSLYKDVGTI